MMSILFGALALAQAVPANPAQTTTPQTMPCSLLRKLTCLHITKFLNSKSWSKSLNAAPHPLLRPALLQTA